MDQLHCDEVQAPVAAGLVDGDDVRVVQGGRGPRLLLQPAHPPRVVREGGGQELERDFAAQLAVFGGVDLGHAARAERREHAVAPDLPPGHLCAAARAEQAQRRRHGRRPVHDGDRTQTPFEQRLDLAPQRQVVAAGRRDVRAARARVQLGGGVKDALDLSPAFGRHGAFVNSRRSHASAICQSRVTVLTETFSASAISSLLSPPKKRSSTTRPLRGSISASLPSASSSASTSRERPGESIVA